MADVFRHSLISQGDFDWAMGLAETNGRYEQDMKAAQDDFTRQQHLLSKPDGGYILDRDETGDGDRVFHFFPKLPAELQLQVWKEAAGALTVPKLLEFEFDLAYDPKAAAPQGRPGNGIIACFRPIRYERELDSHIGMIKACWDSRKAFIDHAGYTMLSLTYLVDPVEEKKREKREQIAAEASTKESEVKEKRTWYNTSYAQLAAIEKKKKQKRAAKEKKAAAKAKKATRIVKKAIAQGLQFPPPPRPETKIFKRVLFPVKLDQSCFLIHKMADRYSYRSVHPSPPRYENVFPGVSGLDFVHSIKKLAFSIHGNEWKPTTLFCDLYATTANRYTPATAPNYVPLTLGALEELSYVSAKAVDRRCCMGEFDFWKEMTSINIQDFQAAPEWDVEELYRLHRNLLAAWQPMYKTFRRQWGYDTRRICTCKYTHL